MKLLIFTLPIAAIELCSTNQRCSTYWTKANKFYCSSFITSFDNNQIYTESCCNATNESGYVTSDGYCTGEDSNQNSWWLSFGRC
jgi:hypothetical protein